MGLGLALCPHLDRSRRSIRQLSIWQVWEHRTQGFSPLSRSVARGWRMRKADRGTVRAPGTICGLAKLGPGRGEIVSDREAHKRSGPAN